VSLNWIVNFVGVTKMKSMWDQIVDGQCPWDKDGNGCRMCPLYKLEV
jgi:hypothetical protein